MKNPTFLEPQPAKRSILIDGVLFTLPVAATLSLTVFLVTYALKLADYLMGPISEVLEGVIGRHLPGLSVVLIAVVLLAVGLMKRRQLGQRILRLLERLLQSAPVVSSIYAIVRQVVGVFGGADQARARRVVFVEWVPGGRVPGLVMNEVRNRATGRRELVVCVPSKPHPTGATLVIVPEEKTCDAGMTPEEVIKWGMSLGTLTPAELTIANWQQQPDCAQELQSQSHTEGEQGIR